MNPEVCSNKSFLLIRKKAHDFVSASFALTKFNCSSFATHDLINLYHEKANLSKSLVNYCFPKSHGPKNIQTLILKESKSMRRERLSSYPKTLVQGLISK